MRHSYLFLKLIFITICLVSAAYGAMHGFFLLYRPIDISNECAFSGKLRYDLSFGMGMSDTITLVFRTITETDYACNVDIVSQESNGEPIYLVVVLKFPTSIAKNCLANADAFSVVKRNKCLRLCDLIDDRDKFSTYFVVTVKEKIRFRFLSNSSINSDINADLYQVTVTSARLKPPSGCYNNRNESSCVIERQEFCFTSGVDCDGIKNCGVQDWFDERKSLCGLPVEYLGHAPVVAVVGALLCALLAGCHILMRCLPPLAHSFFIFNANEDNRLCIDSVFKAAEATQFEVDKAKRTSLIPVFSSTSSSQQSEVIDTEPAGTAVEQEEPSSTSANDQLPNISIRKTTMKTMTEKLQNTIRSVTGRRKRLSSLSNI